jgi:aryl-alcohol dehydrogenase-like predicted oxidoreductase
LKADGVIGRLGVSVTSPTAAIEALNDPVVNAIQLPFNLLDHRWQAAGVDRFVRQRGDVVVHARSVFLQGVLAAPANVWPAITDIQPDQILANMDELVQHLGRVDRVDLCLAFVRAQPWVHSLVIGVETIDQLNDLVQRFECPALSADEAESVREFFPRLPEELLNPSLWPQKAWSGAR